MAREIHPGSNPQVSDDAVKRLKESMRRTVSEPYQRGKTIGHRWAFEIAEAIDLMRLSKFVENHSDWELVGYLPSDDSGSLASQVYRMTSLADQEEEENGRLNALWASAGVGDLHGFENTIAVKGFIDGAIDAWKSVVSRF